MGKPFSSLKNHNVIIWFMTGWRRKAAADHSQHLQSDRRAISVCSEKKKKPNLKDVCLFVSLQWFRDGKTAEKQAIVQRFFFIKANHSGTLSVTLNLHRRDSLSSSAARMYLYTRAEKTINDYTLRSIVIALAFYLFICLSVFFLLVEVVGRVIFLFL